MLLPSEVCGRVEAKRTVFGVCESPDDAGRGICCKANIEFMSLTFASAAVLSRLWASFLGSNATYLDVDDEVDADPTDVGVKQDSSWDARNGISTDFVSFAKLSSVVVLSDKVAPPI